MKLGNNDELLGHTIKIGKNTAYLVPIIHHCKNCCLNPLTTDFKHGDECRDNPEARAICGSRGRFTFEVTEVIKYRIKS